MSRQTLGDLARESNLKKNTESIVPPQRPIGCAEPTTTTTTTTTTKTTTQYHSKDTQRMPAKGYKECSFHALLQLHVYTQTHTTPPLPLLLCSHSPSPKGVRISVDALVIRRRKTDNPTKVLGIVRVPVPTPCDVVGNRWKLRVRLVELLRWQEIDVVKDEDVVLDVVVVVAAVPFLLLLLFSLPRQIETDVEEFPAVEFSLVVGLLYDVDVKVADPAFLVPEVPQKPDHVRNEFRQVFRSFLFLVEVPKGNDDGDARRVSNVQQGVDRREGGGRRFFEFLFLGRLLLAAAAPVALGPPLGHPGIVGLASRREMPLGVLGLRVGIIVALLAVGKGSDPSPRQRELVFRRRSHGCVFVVVGVCLFCSGCMYCRVRYCIAMPLFLMRS